MLIVLLFGFLAIGVLAYFSFGKDMLSPSFLLAVLFSVCAAFSNIGNQGWGVDFSSTSLFVLLACVFLIFLGEACYRALAGPCNCARAEARYDRLRWNKSIWWVLFFVQFALTLLSIKRGYDIASALGNIDSLSSYLLRIRVATTNEGVKYGAFFSIFSNISFAVTFISLYRFISEAKKPLWKYTFRNIHLLFPTLLFLTGTFLGGARNAFIEFAVIVYFLVILIIRKSRNLSISQVIPFAVVLLFSFFLIFAISGSLKGTSNSGFFDSIITYAGSSIVAFDVWIRGFSINEYIGAESFWGLWHLIKLLVPSVHENPQFLEFVTFANGQSTNIYTGFRAFLSDFGYLGAFFTCFMIGLCITWAYSRTKKSMNPIAAVVYGHFLYYFINLLFAPSFTSSPFTSSSITIVFWTIVVGKLMYRKTSVHVDRSQALGCTADVGRTELATWSHVC